MSHPQLVMRIKQETPADLAIVSIVVSELMYGVDRSVSIHRASNRNSVIQLRQNFVFLPFDVATAEEVCGTVRAHLASQGTPIGPNDLQIVSIALANKMILVAHNTSEFATFPGLSIEK